MKMQKVTKKRTERSAQELKTHVVWEADGRREVHYYRELTRDRRPQNPSRDDWLLIIEYLEHGGSLPDMFPLVLKLTDQKGRSLTYTAEPEPLGRKHRPQAENTKAGLLRREVMEYGGDYDDDMPAAIKVTDPSGRWCIYRPFEVGGKQVDSDHFAVKHTEPEKERRTSGG